MEAFAGGFIHPAVEVIDGSIAVFTQQRSREARVAVVFLVGEIVFTRSAP